MDRIAIQAQRDAAHYRFLFEHHNLVTMPAPEDDDKFSGFDRLQFTGKLSDYDPDKYELIGGIWVPRPFIASDWKTCQCKERGRHERTGKPYMEGEVEYIRHRRVRPTDDDYWGREWRNRAKGLDYYDMVTQDRWWRRFEWGPIWSIMEDWHAYLESLSAAEKKFVLDMEWVDDWEDDGLMMLSREDNDGRKKNLLYLTWRGKNAVRDMKPILELPL